MRVRILIPLLLAVFVLAACRPTPSPEPTMGPGDEGGTTPPEETSPWASPLSPLPPPSLGAVNAAVTTLAGELDIPPEDVSVLTVEQIDWRSSALGCPEPGVGYLTVITPGYRVVVEAGGEEYHVHTDRAGRNAVLCDESTVGALDAAIEFLATTLDAEPEDVTILSTERVEWPSSALGCPKPGEAYADVIVPGYVFHLEVRGDRYEIHTDETGNQIVNCTDGVRRSP